MEKLDQGLKRWSSRFERFLKYFGFCIIDTSSQGDDSIADDFIKNNPYGDLVKAVFTNRWIVREHLHYYGQKGWFQVYAGDSIHQPFIVRPEKGQIITPDMDPDRIIKVPEECRADFEFDLITALQDIAGISTHATNQFFSDKSHIRKNATLPMYSPDVVSFDMYDKTDKFIYRFQRTIDEIPSDRIIFIRFDTAVVGDNCGCAIAYFDKWKIYDQDKKVKLPIINVPLAVAIGRKSGEETSLEHIFEFCMDLNEKFEIGDISFDQFQSRMIIQNLEREKVPVRYLSVDRTDEAAVLTKNLINNDLLKYPNNELLIKEASNLRRIGNKVDHPSDGCFVGDTEVIVKYKLTNEVQYISLIELANNEYKYQVLSYNSISGFIWQDINLVHLTKYVCNLACIEFDDGSKYYCTFDHYILTDNGYKMVKDLTVNDNIININIESNLTIR